MITIKPASLQNTTKMMLKSFMTTFLAVGAVLAVSGVVFFNMETKDYLEKIKLEEEKNLDLQRQIIAKSFETIFSDLIFLSKQNELMQLLKGNDSAYKKNINKEYLEFSKRKKIYDQIRFIDETGMEICRINFNKGRPAIVPSTELQSKKNRYYFNDTFILNRGEIYVSPFDLNIEKGEIEKPLKPVIRFGTPVFDNLGRKRGVIVLNYLGNKLISSIKDVAKLSVGHIMLVNPDGYWLKGPKLEEGWGFMFGDRKDRRFGTAYPSEWKKISNKDAIQINTDNGLFTCVTIYPLFEGIKSSTGSVEAFGQSANRVAGEGYYWKLISFVPQHVLHSAMSGLLTKLYWTGVVLFLLASIPCYLIAQAFVRRKRYHLELFHSANFDKLTGLPNRSLFFDRLGQKLNQALRYKSKFSVLFIDLDGFKAVNDSLGHESGDELLVKTAERLRKSVRKSDTVARLGGDEFTIILTEVNKTEDAVIVAQKIINELSTPFTIKKKEVKIGASIGITTFSEDEETIETLLRKADSAMYQAKSHGTNSYKVFS
jgi:diguanylate cyclase (GGDEF)-like protein